jgi:hypothetical protein
MAKGIRTPAYARELHRFWAIGLEEEGRTMGSEFGTVAVSGCTSSEIVVVPVVAKS